MKKNLFKLPLAAAVAFVVFAFTGCVSRLGAFTVISTKNIEWNRANEYKRYNQRVEGEDLLRVIVFIPTKMNVTIEDAVDNALNQIPGAVALVDAVLRAKSFYVPYVYGEQAFMIEGSVLVDPKLASLSPDTTQYFQGYYDANKEFQLASIDKGDFDSITN